MHYPIDEPKQKRNAMSSPDAILSILQTQYQQIVQIETAWNIQFSAGDMRPRVEHFHDAVRAYTAGEDRFAKGTRLSVEHLAYDIAKLREVQARPVTRVNANPHPAVATQADVARGGGPDRATRQELVQLYKDYTVLFVALFAPVAEDNFQVRSDEIDSSVEDMALIEQTLKQLANGAITPQQAEAQLEQVEQDTLRENILKAVRGKKIKRAEADALLDRLSGVESKLEQEKTGMEKAHLNYVTGQLAIYEDAKDTVKRLASQGLNLAGKFVENAMSQATGKGKGR